MGRQRYNNQRLRDGAGQRTRCADDCCDDEGPAATCSNLQSVISGATYPASVTVTVNTLDETCENNASNTGDGVGCTEVEGVAFNLPYDSSSGGGSAFLYYRDEFEVDVCDSRTVTINLWLQLICNGSNVDMFLTLSRTATPVPGEYNVSGTWRTLSIGDNLFTDRTLGYASGSGGGGQACENPIGSTADVDW